MTTEKTNFVVVQGDDGKFLALDKTSGGYLYWSDSFSIANKFTANLDGYNKIVGALSSTSTPGHIREVTLGEPLELQQFASSLLPAVREAALTKLSDIEKQALGLI